MRYSTNGNKCKQMATNVGSQQQFQLYLDQLYCQQAELQLWMLPSLKKINNHQYSATQTKVYYPPKQLNYQESRQDKRENNMDSSRPVSKKIIAGGFKVSNPNDQSTKPEIIKNSDKQVGYQNKSIAFTNKKSTTNLSSEIKLIEKKIRECQRKIEEDKRKKQLETLGKNQDRYEEDFEKIIRKQLELQGYSSQKQTENKNFDYLTNPGGAPLEEIEQEPIISQLPEYSIEDGVEKLEKFYENSLKKKFERREVFPHQACRRKTPKLYITQKTNALNKYGKPQNQEEHKFRVLTKEVTPQEIYPTIPNFAVVKDSLSKNIVAYLGDYKPFLDKTKERIEKQQKKHKQKSSEKNLMMIQS